MPDTDASRLARLEQRVEDLARSQDAFAPTAAAAAALGVHFSHIEQDVAGCRADVRELRSAIDARDAQMVKDRKDTRVALWSLVGVLGAALISGGAAIVVALVTG